MDEKPAKKPSALRNAIGLVLALGGIGIVEVLANRSDNAAVLRLNERLGSDPESDEGNPTLAEVNMILAKTPDPGGDSASRKSYTWNGIFRKYSLAVEYDGEGPHRLVSFNTD